MRASLGLILQDFFDFDPPDPEKRDPKLLEVSTTMLLIATGSSFADTQRKSKLSREQVYKLGQAFFSRGSCRRLYLRGRKEIVRQMRAFGKDKVVEMAYPGRYIYLPDYADNLFSLISEEDWNVEGDCG